MEFIPPFFSLIKGRALGASIVPGGKLSLIWASAASSSAEVTGPRWQSDPKEMAPVTDHQVEVSMFQR
jgi:hypothetical protein